MQILKNQCSLYNRCTGNIGSKLQYSESNQLTKPLKTSMWQSEDGNPQVCNSTVETPPPFPSHPKYNSWWNTGMILHLFHHYFFFRYTWFKMHELPLVRKLSLMYMKLLQAVFWSYQQFVSANSQRAMRALNRKQFNLNVPLFEMKDIAVAAWDY